LILASEKEAGLKGIVFCNILFKNKQGEDDANESKKLF